MPSKRREDVVSSNGNDGVIAQNSAFARLIYQMEQLAVYDSEENKFQGDDIVAILEAETEEEMWDIDERGPISGVDLADCEIVVTDFQVKFSRSGAADDFNTPFVASNDAKMYLLVQARRISDAGEKRELRLPGVGEQFTFNTSARFIVAKLWWARTHGLVDADTGAELLCVIKRVDLGGGQGVLKLRPMPKRVVTA